MSSTGLPPEPPCVYVVPDARVRLTLSRRLAPRKVIFEGLLVPLEDEGIESRSLNQSLQ